MNEAMMKPKFNLKSIVKFKENDFAGVITRVQSLKFIDKDGKEKNNVSYVLNDNTLYYDEEQLELICEI